MLAAQLTAQCVELCRSILTLTEAGDTANAHLLLRSLEESASNLFFVLFGGPIFSQQRGDTPPWTQQGLAKQFFAYQLVDQVGMMNRTMDRMKRDFSTRVAPYDAIGPQTFTAYMAHYESRKAELAKAETIYKFGKGTWHEMGKFDRTKKVLDHLPRFVEPAACLAWQSMHDSYDLLNFQNHGSPILLMGVEAAREGELLGTGRMFTGDLGADLQASSLCVACWLALGDLCGELPLVEEVVKVVTKEHAMALLSAPPPVSIVIHETAELKMLKRLLGRRRSGGLPEPGGTGRGDEMCP